MLPRLAVLGCALLPACRGAPADPDDPTARFASLDGTRVHYRDWGAGPRAVVFVHGWCCDQTVWRFQAPALAGAARLLVVDLPGHGRSDEPEGRYTMDLFARALDAVLLDAGVGEAVLVGHSNGVPVVRQFYRRFPEKTRGLVLVEGSLRRLSLDERAVEGFLARLRGPDYRATLDGMFDGMLPADLEEDARARVKAAALATPRHVAIDTFYAVQDPAIWDEDPIRVPVLVLLAAQPMWTDEYEAFVRRLVPDVDYRVLPGKRHMLMMDDPEAFNATLLGFLDRVFGGG